MKRITVILTLVVSFLSCTNNAGHIEEERRLNYASLIGKPSAIEFDEDSFDFGTVVDGDVVNHTFTFTNTGDENLVLINVKGSCGCTIPENWPTEPIEPGGTGKIDVTFDSKNKVGNVIKNVRIEANTEPSITVIKITGVVKEKF